MKFLPRLCALFFLPACFLGSSAWPTSAQDAKTTTKSASPKRAFDPARRVPDYFGQIGLTPEQRERIYKIRAKHYEKLRELEKQITALNVQMIKDCEGVLDETQKKLLEARREAASVKRTVPSSSTPPTKEVPAKKAG